MIVSLIAQALVAGGLSGARPLLSLLVLGLVTRFAAEADDGLHDAALKPPETAPQTSGNRRFRGHGPFEAVPLI